jgi:lipopolysaccharide export system protein LptC
LNRNLLSAILLLAGLLSIGWWLREISQPTSTTPRETSESPDYTADNLKTDVYGESGQLVQHLETPRMEHFESRDTTVLTTPVLWRYNQESPPWRMQAEKAFAYSETDTIYMPGEVVMQRQGTETHPPYHIVTSDLSVETQTAYATTEAPIRIDSNQQWIEAVGMQGWLKAPVKINLLSQVRGRYVFE